MSLSVILADHHVIFRQGLTALLKAEPDITLLAQAGDGEAAWQLIESHQPDIAILDLAMPKATGIEVACRVEAADINTRVVLLTTHDDASAALQVQDAGVAGYILRDNSFEELIIAVRSIAAGGTFVTPAVRTKLRAFQRQGQKPVVLSPREREVIHLIAGGKSSKEIGQVLVTSPRTVDTYRNRLMEKLGLHSVADVTRWSVQREVPHGLRALRHVFTVRKCAFRRVRKVGHFTSHPRLSLRPRLGGRHPSLVRKFAYMAVGNYTDFLILIRGLSFA